ncbi:MAG: hypothetical protein GX589_03020, partial [Deltaproteobacteria bacterium]|nr:hypothetical protein [Deltaproteobacteria bacterium]
MQLPISQQLVLKRRLLFTPRSDCPWASEMVLNPAIIEDPSSGRIHMLFRATGPWDNMRTATYPIFLGYAWSDDRGCHWEADFSRPALAPKLAMQADEIVITNHHQLQVVNYANGCIEDPRLFMIDGECYAVTACRMFPPGPYWIKDDPRQCAPEWIDTPKNRFGRAASENVTVSVLFRVNLKALVERCYEQAFQYITHLTDPELGENRDVVIFPEKISVNGQPCFVCIHRPWQPHAYIKSKEALLPSMLICGAAEFDEIWRERASQTLLASPLFEWEGDRIGASAPPLRLSDSEWLLCYHGKQDAVRGYTQSFIILEQTSEGLPQVKHRCPERILFAAEPWEMPGRFKT